VAAAAVVILAVPVLLNLPERQDALQQLPATEPTSTATASASAGPTGVPTPSPSPGADGSPVPAGPDGEAPTVEPLAEPAAPPASAASGRPSTAAAGYPPADSCHVSTRTLLTAKESASCQFSAIAAGGWRLVNDAQAGYSAPEDAIVEVRRNGVVHRYVAGAAYNKTTCRNDVIQPGDLVTVTVRQASRGYQSYDLGAGRGYDCRATSTSPLG
jgi:hypothetical protein